MLLRVGGGMRCYLSIALSMTFQKGRLGVKPSKRVYYLRYVVVWDDYIALGRHSEREVIGGLLSVLLRSCDLIGYLFSRVK